VFVRILMFPRYGRLGASSRLRLYQYLPRLRAAGVEADVSPLFSNAYVENLQKGVRAARQIIQSYSRRLYSVLGSKDYDLLWIEKECWPWVPAWIERLLLSSGIPIVLDYDDAVFHDFDLHRRALVRQLLGKKHRRLMCHAELVVAGNEYLADFARKAGAKDVEILPTAIDLDRYPQGAEEVNNEASRTSRVVWIGQRSTAKFLHPLAALFERMDAEGRARFVAIGVDAAELELPMESVPWSEETEVRSIVHNDIGIMPLVDSPFERGKCGYKLIQYMACGLPVVASPVGVNRQLVEHGVNGYLAESLEEWESAINMLASDAELRRKFGAAGRRKVENKYSIQVTGPILLNLLQSAAASTNRRYQ
jgi:glycosyltransferase involved in cell wall biosynthesis